MNAELHATGELFFGGDIVALVKLDARDEQRLAAEKKAVKALNLDLIVFQAFSLLRKKVMWVCCQGTLADMKAFGDTADGYAHLINESKALNPIQFFWYQKWCLLLKRLRKWGVYSRR